ncbi:MAG TPA: hypothetical protein VGX78_10180, partial [Pirellulales bacterium]|nr:hypothetical protein [Pirellulales bacterium]
ASGSSDGTVRVWEVPESKLQSTIQATNAEVRSVAFAPDGTALAAGIRYGEIRIWDADTWTQRASIAGHQGDVWSVAFTADSAALLSGDGDWNQPGQVKLWDAATGRPLAAWETSGEVLSLAVSADDRTFAAGTWDKKAYVWKMSNGERGRR